MKKVICALMAAIVFVGCTPVSTPVNNEVPSSPSSSSSSQSSSSGTESTGSSGSSSEVLDMIRDDLPSGSEAQSSSQPAPMPEQLPDETAAALELPATLATSNAGYGIELLSPAQYDSSLDAQRSGPRGFLGMDVFMLRQNGKYAYANENGKIITDFLYDADIWWGADGGVIPVSRDGKQGIISAADGREIVPCEYDFASAVFCGNGLLEVCKGEQTKILNADGSPRYELERGDQFCVIGDSEFLLQDGMLRIYSHKDGSLITNFACEDLQVAARTALGDEEDAATFQVNGKWGICDSEGNVLMSPVYDNALYYISDYITIRKDGKCGIANYKGEVVVKPEWDDLILGRDSASVCRDDKWGVIGDLDTGELAIEPHYDFVTAFTSGYASFERGGKWGIMDREGNEIVAPQYQNQLYIPEYLERGYFQVMGDEGFGCAGILHQGEMILPTDHYIWGNRLNGYANEEEPYILFSTPRDKYGFFDGTGKIVIDAQYDILNSFIDGKEVAFASKDRKILLLDRQGKTVLETVFSDLVAFNPKTMVGVFQYTNEAGVTKACLAKVTFPK